MLKSPWIPIVDEPTERSYYAVDRAGQPMRATMSDAPRPFLRRIAYVAKNLSFVVRFLWRDSRFQ